MKNYILFLLFSILTLASCQVQEECELNNEYRVRVISDSYDDYALYVDGEYIQDIYSLSYVDLALISGEHEIFLEQLNGYHRQPNTEQYFVRGYNCEYYEIVFPD